MTEIDFNENLESSHKTSLKHTNDAFDYKSNKNNIILHGMKIVNILKKSESQSDINKT